MRIALALVTGSLILVSDIARAQDLRAKTEDGREVILKADGTWIYADGPKDDKKAALAYTGRRGTFALHHAPGVWRKMNAEEMQQVGNKDAEVVFVNQEGDAFAMVIAERIEVPLDTVKKGMIDLWKTVDPDTKVILDEKRMVNGKEVLCLTAELETQGLPLTFHNYIYSGEIGTIQVSTWTGRNLFKELKPELEAFLNGLEILEKKP